MPGNLKKYEKILRQCYMLLQFKTKKYVMTI